MRPNSAWISSYSCLLICDVEWDKGFEKEHLSRSPHFGEREFGGFSSAFSPFRAMPKSMTALGQSQESGVAGFSEASLLSLKSGPLVTS
jgi:hypothetical protein